MKKKLILLSLLISFAASAQKQPYNVFKGDTINRTDAKGLKQGVWKKYYPNDTLFSVGQFKDNHPYGVFKTYYKTGQLEGVLTYRITYVNKEEEYVLSSHTADMIIYNENGKLKAKGKYVNQKKDSVWNYYAADGVLSSSENYVNGIAEGIWKTFYPDGKVLREETYKNGKRNGPYKEYFEDGKPKVTATMMNDGYEGTTTMYYPDGKVWMQGKYIKHVREGVWYEFDETGKKIRENKYKDGELLNPPKEEEPKEKISEPDQKNQDEGH